jgi:50S ribosomal protein L16 3-hydroxylase
MVQKVESILKKIQWSKQDIVAFLGTYLSEPKPDVLFEPNKKISKRNFVEKAKHTGLVLDIKSQMLFSESTFYLNAEAADFTGVSASLLQTLADNRKLDANDLITAHPLNEHLLQQLYDWYLAGFIHYA